MSRSAWIGVGLTAVLLAAVLGGLAWWYRHPAVNRAQAEAIEPAIEAYMHSNAARLDLGGTLDSRLKSQVFCDTDIIEITPAGSRYRVGMVMNCGEYARRGGSLIEGFAGYFISVCDVTMSADGRHYQVRSLDPGPEGYDPAWVHQNFSAPAARWLLSPDPPTAPDPVGQAWQAFGFPPGTPAVPD
jgi:hypothetical protein